MYSWVIDHFRLVSHWVSTLPNLLCSWSAPGSTPERRRGRPAASGAHRLTGRPPCTPSFAQGPALKPRIEEKVKSIPSLQSQKKTWSMGVASDSILPGGRDDNTHSPKERVDHRFSETIAPFMHAGKKAPPVFLMSCWGLH